MQDSGLEAPRKVDFTVHKNRTYSENIVDRVSEEYITSKCFIKLTDLILLLLVLYMTI